MSSRLHSIFSSLARVFRAATRGWVDHHCATQGAALAFYAVFALAPIVIASVYAASAVLDTETVRSGTISFLSDFMGQESAAILVDLLRGLRPGGAARAFGAAVLLLGATAFFAQLQEALNLIWDAHPERIGFGDIVRRRIISFVMVLIAGAVLVVSFLASASVAVVERFVNGRLPGGLATVESLQSFLSFAIATLLFAAVFRFVPDAEVRFRHVWLGAIVTAVLFSAGKWLIGLYLSVANLASSYGAAGSLVLTLLWVYYSSLIVLAGAEFTRAWSRR